MVLESSSTGSTSFIDEEINNLVRVTRSGLSSFSFSFYFPFFLVQFIFIFLFLTPKVRVSDNIGHMTRKVLEK